MKKKLQNESKYALDKLKQHDPDAYDDAMNSGKRPVMIERGRSGIIMPSKNDFEFSYRP